MRRSLVDRAAIVALVVGVSFGASPLYAQGDSLRLDVRTSLLIGAPLSSFGDRVGDALGLEAGLRVSRGGKAAWRLGVGGMLYGHDVQPSCVTTSLGSCRVSVGVVTTNAIWTLEAGPEFGVATGPWQLGGHLAAGLSVMVTNTGLAGDYDPLPILNQQELADGGLVWGGGIGAAYALPAFSRAGIALEVEAQYRQHGLRRYLVEGGISETTTGVLRDVQRSNVSLLSWRVGLRFRPQWR